MRIKMKINLVFSLIVCIFLLINNSNQQTLDEGVFEIDGEKFFYFLNLNTIDCRYYKTSYIALLIKSREFYFK
jgi:hypothetical protein